MKRHKRLIVHLQPVVNNFTTGRPLIKGNRKKLSGVWSPSRLFASGEQGAWYDPSDLSTMFQDSAGTTPVTATGQSVGLILDKSKGLVLGPELVTNGTFDSSTGWTVNANWEISGGTANYSSGGTGGDIEWPHSIVAGKTYLMTFTIVSITGSALLQATLGNVESSGFITSTGFKEARLTAAANRTFFAFYCSGSGTVTIDNITIKELAGNHATQATSASRPVLRQDSNSKYYLEFDGVDDSLATTFASALGSACTLGKAVKPAATVVGSQTVGTTYTQNVTHYGTVLTNDALTGQETTDLTAWLNGKAGN